MVMKYVGGCHCGGVSYRAEVDLSAGTIRCNCTWCTKTGWWVARLSPSAFELVRQDTLKRRAGVVEVFECARCGVKVHACGDMPEMGGPFVNLNVRTLDDAHLAGVSIVWLDGRSDTWAILGQTVYDAPICRCSRQGAARPGDCVDAGRTRWRPPDRWSRPSERLWLASC